MRPSVPAHACKLGRQRWEGQKCKDILGRMEPVRYCFSKKKKKKQDSKAWAGEIA